MNTLRKPWLEMYTLPALSAATPHGSKIDMDLLGVGVCGTGVPAKVLMTYESSDCASASSGSTMSTRRSL